MTGRPFVESERLCILKADRIGDIILLSGYLKLLAERLPDARIDVWVAPDMVRLKDLLHPHLGVHALPFTRHAEAPDEVLASWLWQVDQGGYDHIIIPRFTLGETDVLALRYLETPSRHGFPNFENTLPEDWLTLRLGPARRPLEASVEGPEVDPWSHEIDKYRMLAEWQGIDTADDPLRPAIYIDGEPFRPTRRQQGILVWPGASEPRKRWPVEYFAEVIGKLAQPGMPVVVGGTPDEQPIAQALVDELSNRLDAETWICDTDNFSATFRRIARFRTVLANDTGIAHLAAAAGCRVVSISSAVHDGRFGVRSGRSMTVVADVPCRRCNGVCLFDEPVWPCVTEITPAAVADVLNTRKRLPRSLRVPAQRFEREPRDLFAHAVRHKAQAILARDRQHAQLVLERKMAEDLRARAEMRVQELEVEAANIESRVAQFENRVTDLKDRIGASERREGDLLAQLERMTTTVDRCTEIAEAKQADAERFEALQRERLAEAEELASLRAQLQQATRELADMTQRLGDADARGAQLKQEIEQARIRLDETSAERDDFIERLTAHETRCGELGVRITELDAESRLLRDKLADRDRQCEALAQVEEALSREKQTTDRLTLDVDRLEVVVEETATVRDDLRNKRRATASKLRDAREKSLGARAFAASHIDANYDPSPQRHTWLGPPTSSAAQPEPPRCPRISIITPSFNTAPFIEANIQSVLNQNYPDFEHIIVDGGSGDGTVDICARHRHLRWTVEKDRGQTHAINRGMLLSTGEIVAYLNSDDVYCPGAFDAVAEYFHAHPDCMILVGDCDLIDEQGETTGHWRAEAGRWVDRVRYWGWEKTHCIPQQGIFMRRELLTKVGLFDADLAMVMDLDMWLRATREHELGVVNRTLAGFRLVEGTKTISRTHEMYAEQLAICRRHARHLPLGQRLVTRIGARRHFANMMLKMSEHYLFSDRQRRLPLGLLMRGIDEWPILLANPRTWFTLAQGVTRKTPLWPIVAQPHRAYLGVLWRLRRQR
ncbi:MAG: glycosyltransferase [Phycisphaerales bacterium]|nr:glycosyltransferase [Phycisphaerales bacterium]